MKRQSWLAPYSFSPEEHERELRAIFHEIDQQEQLDPQSLHRILVKYPKNGNAFFSKSEIIRGYRHLVGRENKAASSEAFIEKLRMKPVRSLSGVTPVTVLTQPYPCPGECVFCPSDVNMPKSYLSREPGAQRAARHGFDPYAQTRARLRTLDWMGHPLDKIELIVLGGTWSFYPEAYQIGFIKQCFDALNEFAGGGSPSEAVPLSRLEPLAERVDGLRGEKRYNEIVSAYVKQADKRGPFVTEPASTWCELAEAHRLNETARCRSVGLSVETRPDYVEEEEVVRMRRLGVTKVQIGIQSLADDVLALNRRGHDVATTRRAVRLLRQAGFKVQAHWMPNLYGSSPQRDVEDFERLFADPDFRPDELKIYPCCLIESAELMRHYERGEWRPYTHEELVKVLTACLKRVPRYCRVSRVIRDIPGDDILAGNKQTNLRNVVEAELAGKGARCRDIRSREIRHRGAQIDQLRLETIRYRTSVGDEVFLQFVTSGDEIAGFLRLSLPEAKPFIRELEGSALIREVHVYGAAVELGKQGEGKAQHLGLGTRLIEEAKRLACRGGYAVLSVISAVGTRGYYRRLGFEDGELYQRLDLHR